MRAEIAVRRRMWVTVRIKRPLTIEWPGRLRIVIGTLEVLSPVVTRIGGLADRAVPAGDGQRRQAGAAAGRIQARFRRYP